MSDQWRIVANGSHVWCCSRSYCDEESDAMHHHGIHGGPIWSYHKTLRWWAPWRRTFSEALDLATEWLTLRDDRAQQVRDAQANQAAVEQLLKSEAR